MSAHGPAEVERLPAAKAAIVHDWFQGFHGSERVVEAMRSGLAAGAGAPDVLTFHAAHELLPPELSRAIVHESRVARLPGIRQVGHDPGRWRYLLPLMPRYFRRLDLDDYDLVLSSSHACAVGAQPPAAATHVCYCHTPMRYAWMPATERARVAGARGVALRLAARRLRRIDHDAAQRPDAFIANSQAVRERIERFYDREATVIHPPVDTQELRPSRSRDPGHFLWVHRLVGYKRPELVAEAFRGLPHRLTMVGVGPLEERLRATMPPNVELLGWLPRAELCELYGRVAGFIHLGEEDFGITMVEALAAGTPVLGLGRGGARDIVRPGQDGLLIDRAELDTVREAVNGLAQTRWDREALVRRADEFSRTRFLRRLAAFLRQVEPHGER